MAERNVNIMQNSRQSLGFANTQAMDPVCTGRCRSISSCCPAWSGEIHRHVTIDAHIFCYASYASMQNKHFAVSTGCILSWMLHYTTLTRCFGGRAKSNQEKSNLHSSLQSMGPKTLPNIDLIAGRTMWPWTRVLHPYWGRVQFWFQRSYDIEVWVLIPK